MKRVGSVELRAVHTSESTSGLCPVVWIMTLSGANVAKLWMTEKSDCSLITEVTSFFIVYFIWGWKNSESLVMARFFNHRRCSSSFNGRLLLSCGWLVDVTETGEKRNCKWNTIELNASTATAGIKWDVVKLRIHHNRLLLLLYKHKYFSAVFLTGAKRIF